MNPLLDLDTQTLPDILEKTVQEALHFLQTLPHRPVAPQPPALETADLPLDGLGASKTLERFQQKYAPHLIGSSGPRYFGFVTGGTTPAALAGDWLVSAYDQNATGSADSASPYIERETIHFLRQLFGLSDAHFGSFVSGATLANFVGLATGRQWVGRQHGVNLAQEGLFALPPIAVFSATPHSSTLKTMAMLGMGKSHLQPVATLRGREAMDVADLRRALAAYHRPCIVVASAGTVNSVDFDDLQAITALKEEFNFWLHVDAAFGGFAACSPAYQHLVAGLDSADSITIDAHKWLNVPYDSAMQFTRHKQLQVEVFQNSAAYLGDVGQNPDYVHLTPENSRRLRALPAWFTLMAYGRSGYQEIVERNCHLAGWFGRQVEQSQKFRLLAPVHLNVVCFTLTEAKSLTDIQQFLNRVRDQGQTFLTPTVYHGIPGMRAAFVNWHTSQTDVEMAWESLTAV